MIFLDLDGVLANFHSSVLRALGRPHDLQISDWDLAAALGVSPALFWGVQDADELFWLNIEPYDHCARVVDAVRSTGREVYICTSPSRHKNCASHKISWCRQHLGSWTDGRVILVKDKHLLARTGRMLIDDYEINTQRFTGCGGVGMLFPQPWNSARSVSLDSFLRSIHD